MNLSTILYCLYFFISATSTPEVLVFDVPEVLVFDVIRQDKVIGELRAARVIADDLILLRSQTKIRTHIVKRINVEYEFFVKMDKDKLLSAEATIMLNGKIKEHTTTKWLGNEYRVEDRKGRISWISEPITYAGIHLLFEEPIDIAEVYSEEAGENLSIAPLAQHWYKKLSPKGKENFYHYKNGKLFRANMKAGMMNFQIALRQEL